MGLTNPGRDLERSCLLLISRSLRVCLASGPFPQTYFDSSSLLALLVKLNLSLLIGALAWFIKITKVVPFESVKVFRVNVFHRSWRYTFLSSLMLFRPLCLLPSAALFTLTIWPFAPPRSPLRWRPHKELCFDWSAGLSTQCEQM